MRHDVSRRADSQDAFTDLLFNALLGFAFMFVAAFALINTPEEPGKIDAKAEVLITVRWPDRHPDDVDALVEGPRGNLVWYHNRDTGLMHLDRDDRGVLQDRLRIDGREVTNPLNQETVTVRALQPGEYVVNVLHYQANYAEPLPVTVKVEKLNPQVVVLYYGTVELEGAGAEVTALRFSIGKDGEVLDVNERPKRLLTHRSGKP
jgi:hypothetical protein